MNAPRLMVDGVNVRPASDDALAAMGECTVETVDSGVRHWWLETEDGDALWFMPIDRILVRHAA